MLKQLILALLFGVGIPFTAAADSLDFPVRIDKYDGVCIGETLYVLVYNEASGTLLVRSVFNGTPSDPVEPDGTTLYPGADAHLMQATPGGHVAMRLDDSFRIADWLRPFPASDPPVTVPIERRSPKIPRFPSDFTDLQLLDAPNASYLLYTDNSGYVRFVLALDNMNRQYSKQYMVMIRDGKASEPYLLRPGRIDGYSIVATLAGDTLLAAWQEEGMRMAWFGPFTNFHRENKIVFCAFDGKRWSGRTIVAADDEPMNGFGAVIGMHRLDDRLFVFWRSWARTSPREDYEEIHFKSSRDRVHWSPRESLPLLTRLVGHQLWSAAASSDGRLHVLTRLANEPGVISYLIFDGHTWENLGAVTGDDARLEKIVVDSRNRAYAVWLPDGRNPSTVYFRRLQKP